MEIYADVIFFVNFIFSYVLLYILGKFVNTMKIKKLRLAVAAGNRRNKFGDYILYRNADVDFVCAEMRGDVCDDNNSLF